MPVVATASYVAVAVTEEPAGALDVCVGLVFAEFLVFTASIEEAWVLNKTWVSAGNPSLRTIICL